MSLLELSSIVSIALNRAKRRDKSKILFNCVIKMKENTSVCQVKYTEDIPLLGGLVGADQKLQYGEHGGDHAPHDRH